MNRRWLCASTAVVSLLTQAAFAANIFVSGQDPASTQLSAITTDPFTFGSALSTVPGTTAVFGSTTGQKFYAIGSGSADNVAVLSGGFPYVSLGTRIQVSGPTTSGALTPDGRRLVLVGRNGTAVIDTTSDQVLVTMNGIDTGFSPTSVATSVDSRYAYVLSPTSGRVTQIDLTTNRGSATALVPNTSTGIAVAPTGVVYVAAPGGVYELDPVTLATRAFIAVSGTPDKLQFTPTSSRFAIARNLNSTTGRSLIEIDTQSRTQITTPAGSAFSKFVLASDTLGYGLVSGNLIEVQIDGAGNIVQTTPSATGTIPGNIADIGASGETLGSRHLLISSGTNVYDFNLRTRDVSSSAFTGFIGIYFECRSRGHRWRCTDVGVQPGADRCCGYDVSSACSRHVRYQRSAPSGRYRDVLDDSGWCHVLECFGHDEHFRFGGDDGYGPERCFGNDSSNSSLWQSGCELHDYGG